MKITGILCDKDDTLVNLADFWRTPIRRTCCCLARRLAGRENLQLTEQLCRAAGFQDGRLLEESLVVAGTNRDIVEAWKRVAQEHGFLLDEKLAESAACFLERSCQQDSLVIPTEEALPKLFVQLKKRGLVLGVVTSDNYAPTLHALEKLGLCSFFSAIYSADRLQRPKPDPEAAQQFCEKYHLPPQQVAMVGDSVNDMRFAQNSGVLGIFYRPRGEEKLPDGAQWQIRSLQELLTLV